MTTAMLVAILLELVTLPLFGALSDRIGRKPVYLFGAACVLIATFPVFGLVYARMDGLVWIGLVAALALGHSAMYGPQAAFITELFPTRIRYSGVSLAYQLTAIFAGSLAPIIALALYQEYGSWLPVAIYVGVACVISGVSALLARETKGVELAEIR